MRVRLLLFAALFCQGVYAAEPGGMILFKSSPDSPDETARAIEFSKAERFAQVTNYVPLEGGSSVRLFNNQLVALIFYPKIEGQTISSPEQIALLKGTAEQMKVTATKFPTTLERLTPPYRAVQAALAQIDSGKVLIAGEWKDKAMIGAPASGGETLKVKLPDGTEREYTGVRITGKNIDSLKITHSGGAATIPYEQLPEELQKRHGFDATEIAKVREEKAKKAMAATGSEFVGVWRHSKPGEVIGKTAAPGTDFILELRGDSTCKLSTQTGDLLKVEYEAKWRPYQAEFLDTNEPFSGIVIDDAVGILGAIHRSSVFVFGSNTLRQVSNKSGNLPQLFAGAKPEEAFTEEGRKIRKSDLSERDTIYTRVP
jgi:hypothetical protein